MNWLGTTCDTELGHENKSDNFFSKRHGDASQEGGLPPQVLARATFLTAADARAAAATTKSPGRNTGTLLNAHAGP
jgi:hypothetical protein